MDKRVVRTGGQAFPGPVPPGQATPQKGMTLRDYFAAKAMHALVEKYEREDAIIPDTVAERSYQYANAMLEARGK